MRDLPREPSIRAAEDDIERLHRCVEICPGRHTVRGTPLCSVRNLVNTHT